MTLVSVIIPPYNYARYLCEAIDSVLVQTYKDYEIIVVDDGSTDNTKEVLRPYRNKIKYIYQENKGLSAARNTGIRASKGDYFQFLDADDIILPEKISKQIDFFTENKDYSICYCECITCSENIRDSSKYIYRNAGPMIDPILQVLNLHAYGSYPLPIHTLLIKRDIFDKVGLFCEELKAVEDREFLIRVILSGYEFGYLRYYGALYRVHTNQMLSNKPHITKYLNRFNQRMDELLSETSYEWGNLQYVLANNHYRVFKQMKELGFNYQKQNEVIKNILWHQPNFCPEDISGFKKMIVKLFGFSFYIKISRIINLIRVV